MSYFCGPQAPNHFIPQSYGEVLRADMEERERVRAEMQRKNGRPEAVPGVFTLARFEWAVQIMLGYRCWYCGALSPEGKLRFPDKEVRSSVL